MSDVISERALWTWDRNTDEVKPCSMEEGCKQYGTDAIDRHVADTEGIDAEGEEVRVSTVFLVINHGYGAVPLLLFETMIFGGANDQAQERYATAAGARSGHVEMVRMSGIIEKGK